MQMLPSFGVQLLRLAGLRGDDPGSLALRAAVDEHAVTSVLDGVDLLAAFAALLDIAPRDVSALTGIALPDGAPAAHPDAVEAAELIWHARRLTAAQLQQVNDRAHAIRHERAEELDPGLRCDCDRRR
ncbi:hypothetical protein OHA72_42800 [Dactylosporangium sp. NBC_01737]|uniref:hypothetical protein n=1 Tax=Dactylosporangium sp. NBC_01737 TaxID=2975959 RepID=UPI002E146800|nr:hypothetical protein OHA72_42800 [Dactylosporangium sp. NBC_01737]